MPTFEYAKCLLSKETITTAKAGSAPEAVKTTSIEHDKFSKLRRPSETQHEIGTGEVEKYLQQECARGDPLEFWTSNKLEFPTLYKLAKHFLSIPASTGDVERLFSITGHYARCKRASLHPKTIEKLILYREFRRPQLEAGQQKLQSLGSKRPFTSGVTSEGEPPTKK